MFKIDKRMVQLAQPANIPLIPIILPEEPEEPEAAVNLEEKVAATNLAAAAQAQAIAKAEEQEKVVAKAEAKAQAIVKAATQAAAEAEAQAKAQREQLMREAQQAAEQLRQEAEQKAAGLLAEAEQQAVDIREQASQEGHQQGHQEGHQQGLEEARQILAQQQQEAQEQISGLLTEITGARDDFFRSFEGEMINLALAVAGKITHTVIQQDDTVIRAIITNALKNMQKEGKISIRVSQKMYKDFFNAESATFVLGDESIKATIEGDPLLNEGDLLLEAEGETVNAGLESQLKYITLAFGQQVEPKA